MNRLAMIGISTAAAAATMAGGVAAATAASAVTARPQAARSAASASCAVTTQTFAFPKAATTYRAGAAGSVKIAPVNWGTIRVAGLSTASGYKAFIDSRSGSSVNVYFSYNTKHVKFEAEITDSHRLAVTVTSCG